MTKGSGLQSGRACLAGRIIALRCPFFQHKMSGSQKTDARPPQPASPRPGGCVPRSTGRSFGPHEGSRESSPCPLPSLSALCASDPSCDTPSKTHTESASGFRKEPSKGTQSIPRMSLNHPEVCTARREHAPSPGAQSPQSSQGNADRGVWPSRKIRASGRQDSNLRHPAPKAGALPG